MSYVYLASPYSHPDPLVREERYLRALKVATDYLNARVWIYSPIVHCHEMAKIFGLPKDHEFWLEYDRAMIQGSEKVLVLRLEGWQKSLGVSSELAYCTEIGKPWEYL